MSIDTSSAVRHRLVTRCDFDGLVCAALLKELGLVDEILFVHPKDMQDGKIEVGPGDITTNLPYVPGVALAFDHHASEAIRVEDSPENHVIVPDALRRAGGLRLLRRRRRFPSISAEMMEAVDKADSAQFTEEEILDPQGWILMNFLMDPRTGLGRFREFRISNYQLMMQLIDNCTELTVEEILAMPDVAERVELYHEHRKRPSSRSTAARPSTATWWCSTSATRRSSTRQPLHGLRAVSPKPTSPSTSCGASSSRTRCSPPASRSRPLAPDQRRRAVPEYGGGGHHAAGTCQVANEDAKRVLGELVEAITADG